MNERSSPSLPRTPALPRSDLRAASPTSRSVTLGLRPIRCRRRDQPPTLALSAPLSTVVLFPAPPRGTHHVALADPVRAAGRRRRWLRVWRQLSASSRKGPGVTENCTLLAFNTRFIQEYTPSAPAASRGQKRAAPRAAARGRAPGPPPRECKIVGAVKQRGCVLDHASEELRNNKDVALAAVTQAPAAFESVSPAMCADKAFVLAAVASPPSLPLSDFERPPADFVKYITTSTHLALT